MDRSRVFLIWLVMAATITVIAYLFGASWLLAVLIGVLSVAAVVGGATGFMYWKQRSLIRHAAQFDMDLKNGKIHPANLRRMYFSGGKARKDALFIAARAMNCSEQEAERRLREKVSKQAANQEMAKQQPRRYGRPR